MTRGRITIDGNAGMHLGAYMKGGTIEVTGNASDWVGARDDRRADPHRAATPAARSARPTAAACAGMSGGTILVDGSAGLEVGMRMKRGIIVIGGPVRDFAGLQMKGGTIVLAAAPSCAPAPG